MVGAPITYNDAFRYVAAWASFDNDDIASLSRSPHEFHGHLGSLDFEYSDQEKILHVFGFVSAGAGPLVTNRPEIKTSLDQIARQQPEETARGVFEVKTLEWNKQAGPELEPCLWLRSDILNNSTSVADMVKQLNHLSTTAYLWHRQKLLEVQRAYWKTHPKTAK